MTSTVYYDYDQLTSAYEQASRHDMPANWHRALDRGYDLLLASDAITVIYGPLGSIDLAYIPSQSEPGKTHHVNGQCDCEAGQHGKPCAHRAAKRLLNIANEQAAQRVARKRSSVPMTAAQRTGVSREQAMADMAELFN
jgi:hypothetical protein